MSRSKARCLLLGGVLACFSFLASGCGGGAKTPSVANLGTTTSNGAGGSAGSGPGLPSSGDFPVGSSMSFEVGTAGVKYTACMRSHGVPNYPDPNAQGTITITISTSLNPRSPLFQKAQGDCQHLVPAGKAPSPARQQQMKERALAFSACMRSHGVPRYPDPTFGSGGMVSQGISRSEADPNSPIFKAAQTACRVKQTT